MVVTNSYQIRWPMYFTFLFKALLNFLFQEPKRRVDNIDIVLNTSDIASKIKNFRAHFSMASDHALTSFKLWKTAIRGPDTTPRKQIEADIPRW